MKILGDTKNLIWYIASSYIENKFGCIYELIKNQKEAGAKEVRVEIDIAHKEIIVMGNATTILDTNNFQYLFNNVGNSSKGLQNHGIGIFSFLPIGKSLSAIGKNNDRYYIGDINEECISNYEGQEMSEILQKDSAYRGLINELGRYKVGSIWRMEDVGNCGTPMHVCHFNMKDKFVETDIKRYLIGQVENWKTCNVYFRFNDEHKKGDWEQINIIRKKYGKNLSFVIPSKEVELDVNTRTFTHMGKKFEISAHFHVRFTNDILKISVNGLDYLDLRTQVGFRRGASLYNDTRLKFVLSGCIDIEIKALDGGQIPTLYDTARRNLMWGSDAGRCMEEVLMRAANFLRPHLDEFVRERASRKYQAQGEKLSYVWQEFLVKNSNLFGNLFNTGLTPGPNKWKLQCECGSFNVKTDYIASTYECLDCHKKWARQKHSTPKMGPYTEPQDEKKRERQQLKGRFGFNVHIGPLVTDGKEEEHVMEPSSRQGMDIWIYTNHKTWESLPEVEKAVYQEQLIGNEILFAAQDSNRWSYYRFLEVSKNFWARLAKEPCYKAVRLVQIKEVVEGEEETTEEKVEPKVEPKKQEQNIPPVDLSALKKKFQKVV